MTLKGSLEVLNLSDIFQSLSMNQHTGTLRVTDGDRERLVYFADGEITLLASEKKTRLGDMLIAEGKIAAEDLEYAIDLQKRLEKQGECKRLGEILVEEGFVSEDDITAVVRKQIEEEIYDLFLWKQAEFEFLIGYCPEELKQPGHNVTHLKFNTGSLIMEAMRRLDEWEEISAEIPSRKEIFRLTVDPGEVERVPLPPRLAAEVHRIDGAHSVEQLLDETTLSEFEVHKLLFELKRRGMIAALSPEELSDRAEEAYARGRFREAAALYERLAEVLPKNRSIRLQLAEALKAYGDDERALEQYEYVAEKLERQKNYPELGKIYRTMLDLAPQRADIREKLRGIDRAYRRAGLFRVVSFALFMAALAFGAVWAVRNTSEGRQVFERVLAYFEQTESKSDQEVRQAEIAAKRKEAKALLEQGREQEAFSALLELRRLLGPNALQSVALPLRVRSLPPGKEVFVNGTFFGRTDDVFTYLPGEKLDVEIREAGRVLYRWPGLDPLEFHDLMADFYRKPRWTYATGAAVRCAPVVHDGVAYFASLDGYLYGVRLSDRFPSLRLSLREGALDPFGEAVSQPAIVRDRLIVGNLDGNVLTFDLGARRRLPRRRVAERPLLAGPVIVEDGQSAVFAGDDGSVIFFSLRDNALERSIPVCANRISADLATAGGSVFVAGEDNRVVAVDVGTRSILWQYVGKDDFRAAPCPVGDDVVVGDGAGELTCLAGRTGVLKWRKDLEAAIVGMAASPDGERLVVASADGNVRALAMTDGEERWVVALEGGPGVPACDERAAYVCTRTGVLRALDLEAGIMRWSARLMQAVRARPVLAEGLVLIGSEDGRLYAFDASVQDDGSEGENDASASAENVRGGSDQ